MAANVSGGHMTRWWRTPSESCVQRIHHAVSTDCHPGDGVKASISMTTARQNYCRKRQGEVHVSTGTGTGGDERRLPQR